MIRLNLLLLATAAHAQPISLASAVERAQATYPSISVSRAQADEAAAAIRLARTAYLPRLDGVVQLDRGTHNNVFGPLLPQNVISPISGPVLDNSFRNNWASAAGLMVAWEPFDFGQRHAGVASATASTRQAEASIARTRHEVGAMTADFYLTILAADQTVSAAQAAVERTERLVASAAALADAGLRPRADLERGLAERAAANTQLIHAEQAAATARLNLAQMLGVAAAEVQVDPKPYLDAAGAVDNAAAANPAIEEQRLAVESAKARARLSELAYFPKLQLMANTYARGTGARADGSTGGAIAGIGPNIGNWVVGFQATFPILEIHAIRARQEIERRRLESENARLDLIRREVNTHVERARLALAAAEKIARQTPIQVDAARRAEAQVTARYKSGLATITEIADAQRTLTQAEIDDALARLNIWRSRLAIASAQGDLAPFLAAAKP
jgi:outer membrane protein TolC